MMKSINSCSCMLKDISLKMLDYLLIQLLTKW